MKSLGRNWIFALIFALSPSQVLADLTALIPESTIAVIAEETSGVAAKRNLDTITLYHRTRASSQPEVVAERAVVELGAAGIISYAPNQKSAWWKEDDRLVEGKRTVGESRHWLLAECRAQCRASTGWLEPGDVAAYLAALERIGAVL